MGNVENYQTLNARLNKCLNYFILGRNGENRPEGKSNQNMRDMLS